jgi:hypothetical protein
MNDCVQAEEFRVLVDAAALPDFTLDAAPAYSRQLSSGGTVTGRFHQPHSAGAPAIEPL